MKRLLFLASFLLLACGSPTPAASPSPLASPDEEATASEAPPPVGSVALSSSNCPVASAHVYHPQRLHLLAGCRELSLRGTIDSAKPEADGDYHLRLHLDLGQKDPLGGNYLNSENLRQQRGDLVLEPVCERSVTQADAVAACQGYHNPLSIPSAGTRVVASGFWVFDAQHGWYELHPLTGLQRLP